MHKFKSRASHLAWYAEPDGSRSLNPFGKYRPRASGPDDEELGRTHSAADAADSAEQGRRRSDPEKAPVPHSSTMPCASAQATSSDHIASASDDAGVDPKDTSAPAGPPQPGAGETVNAEQANGEPRQRKNGLLGKLHLKRSKNDAAQEPDESTQKKEKKGRKKKVVHYSIGHQIRATIFNSWINLLLVFVPIGIAVNFVPSIDRLIVFILNFIAIIPLAALLSYATEEISLHTGETIGGLLNASFGNAVELIVSIIALFHDEILIVQTSLIGSMLSNLLLVMGMCFFFGGLNRVEQHFNVTVAQTACSLLALAIASLIIPTAYTEWANLPGADDDAALHMHVTQISRGTSIMLLVVYGCYLFFQLHTHADIYNAPSDKAPKRKEHSKAKGEARKSLIAIGAGISINALNEDAQRKAETGERGGGDDNDDEEGEQPQLSLAVGVFTLLWSTALIGVCAEFLVDSINTVVLRYGVSETFVGLILLPIIGNAAEHATSVTVACKDKMVLAIGVAVGSSMQVALLVLPLVVTIGWIAGKGDMDLDFNSFEIIVLFVSVLLVNYLIGDGKSHWLEGVLLTILYLIIALAAWFFPNNDASGTGHST